MTSTAAPALTVTVDDDRLQAFLKLDARHGAVELTAPSILTALGEAKININEDVRRAVDELCEKHQAGDLDEGDLLVARGTPVQPSVDAEFVSSESVASRSDTPPEQADDPNDRVDYFAQCRLAIVEEGEVVGAIVPARPGVPGIDVFGQPIPVIGTPHPLTVGEGLRIGDDQKTLHATIAGVVRVNPDGVKVADLLEIHGDVDFDCGCINAACDVVVKGTIRDRFDVETTKSLSVGEAIENCQIAVGENVAVAGGIAGKEHGVVTAKGHIVCKYCEAATLNAEGDITITKESIGSNIRTMSRLRIPRGALIGGTAHARGGVEARELGSDAEVPTRVFIGLDPVVLAEAAQVDGQVEKLRQSAEKIRSAVGPLMNNLKRLSPSQRERATELMFQADSLEGEADELIANKEAAIEEGSWHEEPAIAVSDRIHPGTILISEDIEFAPRQTLRGPVKIFKRRKSAGVPSGLVCQNLLSGSRRELPYRSHEVELPDPPQDEETTDPAEKSS